MKNKIIILFIITIMFFSNTVLAGRYSDEMYGGYNEEEEFEHERLRGKYYNELYSEKDEYGYPINEHGVKSTKQIKSYKKTSSNTKMSPVAVIIVIFLLWFFGIFEYIGLLLRKIFNKKENE